MARAATGKRAVVAMGLVATLAASLLGVDEAPAAKTKRFGKADQAAQSGIRFDANGPDGTGLPVTMPGDPFSFPKLKGRVRSVSGIEITLTMDEGDTEPGGQFEGTLTLALDGIDTGIELAGFRDQQTDTRTIKGRPQNAKQIAAALRADGELVATLVSTAQVNVVELPGGSQATLRVKGEMR